jgi:hypothetical protein
MSMIHLFGIAGIFYVPQAATSTIYLAIILYFLTGLSITGGLHRFWSHRSYTAKRPLQLFYRHVTVCHAVFCHFYSDGQAWHIARLWNLPNLQNKLPTCVDVRSLLRATASFKIT